MDAVSKQMPLSQPSKLSQPLDRPGQPMRVDRGTGDYVLAVSSSDSSGAVGTRAFSDHRDSDRHTAAVAGDAPAMWEQQQLPLEQSLLRGTLQQFSWIIAVEEQLGKKRMKLTAGMRKRLEKEPRVTFIKLPAGTREAAARNIAAAHIPAGGLFDGAASRYLIFARPQLTVRANVFGEASSIPPLPPPPRYDARLAHRHAAADARQRRTTSAEGGKLDWFRAR